jgi:hypothetical protein
MVGLEELHHLGLGGPRPRVAAAAQPPHQLEVRQVAGRELVHPALSGERQHLQRPAADSRDLAEPAPAQLVV